MASTRSHNQSVNLTKTVVDKTPLPASGQLFLRDPNLKGFGVRIMASGIRSFIVEKRINGKVRRVTLGRYGELTCEQARKEAVKLLGQLAMGHNPIAERERERMRALTMEQVFADFAKARSLKERTLYDYGRLVEVAFAAWKKRPLVAMTRSAVLKLHQELGDQRGEAYANLAMRFLRSLFNFAIAQYEDAFGRPLMTDNPVLRLTQTRAWYHAERRQTVIKVWELCPWYAAVNALRSEAPGEASTVADYLEFLLYTGLRRQEAARLTWEDVDLKDRTIRIADTKNRVPHVLPLPEVLITLLQRRREEARNGYVFTGEGPQGFLVEPKRGVTKVVAASNVSFTLHDLRRTFITIAEGLDIAPYAIKRLVNHKMRNDVTAGYIVSDVERLRAPMQKIADFLDRATGRSEGAEVLCLPGTAA
jgi:integrase